MKEPSGNMGSGKLEKWRGLMLNKFDLIRQNILSQNLLKGQDHDFYSVHDN